MTTADNLKAFLATIAHSEGTTQIPGGDDGYRVLVGSTPSAPSLFTSYADHPRTLVWLPRLKVSSTAAGRYQILARIYDSYKKSLFLDNFSPASQDAIAIQMIRERHAVAMLEDGDFAGAVHACSNLWASLPRSDFTQGMTAAQSAYSGQRANSLADLRSAYTAAGGLVAEDA